MNSIDACAEHEPITEDPTQISRAVADSAGLRLVGGVALFLGLAGLLRAVCSIGLLGIHQSLDLSARGLDPFDRAMLGAMAKIDQQFLTMDIFTIMFHFAVAGGLVFAGFMAWNRIRRGDNLLRTVATWAIVFELGREAIILYRVMLTHQSVMALFEQFPTPPNTDVGYQFGIFVSTALGFMFVAGKVGFYAVAVYYANRVSRARNLAHTVVPGDPQLAGAST